MIGSTLGKRIYFARVWRQRQSLSEFGAAIAREEGRRIPYTGTSVSEWEKDRRQPTLKTLTACAKVSGINATWLVFGEGEPLPDHTKAQAGV